MVYPDGTMYGQVKPEDAAEIVDEHLGKGKVVERLASDRTTGRNATVKERAFGQEVSSPMCTLVHTRVSARIENGNVVKRLALMKLET